jgi:hypothetical protein
MGRYSPPAYVTDRSGELLAQALEQATSGFVGGIERGRERKRQSALDADGALDRKVRLYDAGVRPGQAPSGDISLPGIDTSADLSFPTGSELARHLSIGDASSSAPPAGTGDRLASALPTPPITTNRPATFDGGFSRPSSPSPAPAAPAPIGHPGAFDPSSGAFRDGKGVPKIAGKPVAVIHNPDRYAQIDDTHYIDRTATPEARAEASQYRGQELARELALQERQRRVDRYVSAGYSPADAEIAVDNPGMADNIWLEKHPKPGTLTNADKMTARIKELMTGGMKLDAANKQARLEFGETNAQDPSSRQSMQTMQRVLTLQGHFNSDRSFTQAQDVAAAYQKIKSAATSEHTATSDMSLVYGLMKMQDPGSTVREGEYATAENAKGVPDYLRNLYNKAKDGDILSERQRQQFFQTADGLARAHRKVFAGTLKRYSDMASRYEVDPRDVVFDPFEAVLEPDQPKPGVATAGTKPPATNPYPPGR